MRAARSAQLGLDLLVFVEVYLDKTTPDAFDRFAAAVRARRKCSSAIWWRVALTISSRPGGGYGGLSALSRRVLLALPAVRETRTYGGDGGGQKRRRPCRCDRAPRCVLVCRGQRPHVDCVIPRLHMAFLAARLPQREDDAACDHRDRDAQRDGGIHLADDLVPEDLRR